MKIKGEDRPLLIAMKVTLAKASREDADIRSFHLEPWEEVLSGAKHRVLGPRVCRV